MEKYTFDKKRRFRVVAISDCPIPTYKLELEFSLENDPDEKSESWLNELLLYTDNFSKALGMLCYYLDIEVLKYDFFKDERKWTYFED
nr:MAG TPA: hypothetical protein [Inoviridae sp.]